MNKVLVLGCSGAGKSTLSRKIQEISGLPLIHLDQHYWKPHWVEPDKQEWEQIVNALIQRPRWIMDGNYGGTLDLRIPAADTLIFLNFSTYTCIFRVLRRIGKYYGQVRPDMPVGCPERLNWPFLEYVWNYKRTRGKKIMDTLQKWEEKKDVYILHNDKEVQQFLEGL